MRALLGISLALASIGCGGSSTSDGSTGGGAGAGGSAGGSGGTAAGGGSGGAGAVGGSSGSGGSASCSDYANETPPPVAYTVRLKNARATPIYIGGGQGCGPVSPFALTGPDGNSVPLFAGGCGHTCESLQQHGNYCSGACMMPAVIEIDAGGYYDATWGGTTFEAVAMPTSCYFEPEYAGPTCDKAVVAEAGSYGAVAQAGTQLDCSDVATCTCKPSSTGACEIQYGGSVGGEQLAAKTAFTFPPTTTIEVIFQ